MNPSVSPSEREIALYGKDSTPRIVGVHPLLDRQAERPTMRLYFRSADGTVKEEDVPFYPFFFLSDAGLLKGFTRSRYKCQELNGPGFYRYAVAFSSWPAYWDAIRHIERSAGEDARKPLYLINSPAQQYLVQSGRTLFKGMAFDDIHRMQIDIETYTEHEFPNARRPDDRIVLIALHDNRGWNALIDGRHYAEEAMLRRLAEIVQSRDPDVIEGHNILGFDFPYILERARLHGVSLSMGRDGSVPRTFTSSVRAAERAVEFTAVDIAGRHVIDTYFQVLAYDVIKRDMPGYSLKAAARYFGFASPNRTYVDGGDIARTWREDPERLARYAMDDVQETEELARRLSGSTFYLTQIVPMPYGQASRVGPAAKIESLFIREYLRRKEALPHSEWGTQTAGGYTDVFFTGVAGPIVYADVESLYPSIMIHYGIKPKGDSLGLFGDLLQQLTALRIESKTAMKASESREQRSELDARQASFKILINSFYGQLGFSLALFNDFSEADRVAQVGQEILRKIIRMIVHEGGRVIEVDTDGVLFVPPHYVRGKKQETTFVRHLNRAMPPGIRIGFEGRYRKMLSYKKKNYALLEYDGRLRFKGSSLVSRSTERFGRRFVREAIRRLLEEDIEGLHRLYLETRDQIVRHAWEGVETFCRTETLKDTVDQYRSDVEKGRRPRSASYELSIGRARRTGQPVRKGDRVSFYVTGQSAGVTAFENCRLAEEWNPDDPDENTAFYLKRLDEFAHKFGPFFRPHDFRLIFSPEDLFGFSSADIRLQFHERPVNAIIGDGASHSASPSDAMRNGETA